MQLDACDYELPPELIAQQPARVRDRARLLLLDRARDTLTHARVRDLVDLLTPQDVLVINDTKVFPARLLGKRRGSGGNVEFLLVRREGPRCWRALVKPSHRLAVGAEVVFEEHGWIGVVGERDAWGMRCVEFRGLGRIRTWLARCGRVPLPPYIKPLDGGDTRTPPRGINHQRRYQTVYARHLGSVAAPTAGLHFTRSMLGRLQAKGVEVYPITLHVGPGTFRPIRTDVVEAHSMDAEQYWITPDVARSIDACKAGGKRLIAVGTTTARALESAAGHHGRMLHLEGEATLFIYPGYRFKVVDGLLTNFHLPRSTPLLLVMALAGRAPTLAAYRTAIVRQYRFYSYGDAMLIV
ncbi:MAG: tRNA preQ1(34) S-adenosylmethionine ribosyltransferase-isomerase QueA [Nitrospinae bacterium]|nr:tRNA preQ1(34) S-adenosylmethionine ribosyltransferase-isomerase QueA [Nitrospinota bacterium]